MQLLRINSLTSNRLPRVLGAFLGLLGIFLLVSPLQARYIKTGIASYYGKRFHGRLTANGETYNMYSMTCAHRTLPFGTRLKVTNTTNGKSVVVRVNDRGPYNYSRIIDLSKAAGYKIGLQSSGTAKVKLVEVSKERAPQRVALEPKAPKTPEKPDDYHKFKTGKAYSLWGTEKHPIGYGIQVSAFADLNNAKERVRKVLSNGITDVFIQVGWSNKKRIYRILIGEYPNRFDAERRRKRIRRKGFTGFVTPHFIRPKE